jgi:hypothetical protein
VLVVVAEGITTHDELQNASSLLSNTPVIGTVLNRSQEKVSPYFS